MSDGPGADGGSEVYEDNLAHLADELGWLDLVIELAVLRQAAPGGAGGLAISEEAVAAMLERRPPAADTAGADALLADIARSRETITGRVAASVAAGVALRLPRLAALFALSPFERDVLVVALAVELDGKYERLYAYLHDDVTRRAPTVELIGRLLCQDAGQRVRARGSLRPSSPLYRFALLDDTPGERGRPLLARPVKLDEGIAHYLLGGDEIDARVAAFTRLLAPRPPGPDGEAPLGDALQRYLSRVTANQWVSVFHGPDRAGQEEAARGACAAVDVPLLRADLDAMGDRESFDADIRLVFREAALQGAAVLLDGAEALARESDRTSARARSAGAAMLEMGWITFVTGARAWEPPDALKRQRFFTREFPGPSYPERRRLWRAELNGAVSGPGDDDDDEPGPADADLDEIAAQFRFTRGEIRNAASLARTLALLRGDGGGSVGRDDLRAACRAESNTRLLTFGRRVRTGYGWDDLVLPAEPKTQLREIVDYIRHHEAVYSAWGFGEKHAMGRAVNVLFSGPSGTGKTMAAAIMAGELGLDLYKIDLSTVVSKYIGETEKNLSRVFKEAETSNAILFFDEADALFGKRSEVKDAHDRYANIEVNFLLQKMEEHEGVVILATNFSKNVDEAFTRRLHFAVLFPWPEKDERLAIWRGVFPPAAPLGDDVDLEFLARRFKISGGNVKNIALGAAFLAETEGASIGMRHLILATKREFQKMGKICAKADFGDYYELVT